MAKCMTCGNNYDKTFEVVMVNETYTFDCFECAIHKLAPNCSHCHCRIIGHGVEAYGEYYCCAHCARQAGVNNIRDNA